MAFRREGFAQRRRAVGYSQEQLAERLGVERSTVVRWERGETEPQPGLRPAMAQALQVSLDQLDRLLTGAKSSDVHAARAGAPEAGTGHPHGRARATPTLRLPDNGDGNGQGVAAPSPALAERLVWALERPGRVSGELLDELHQRSAVLGRAYHGVPAEGLIHPARRHVDTIVRLSKGSMTAQDRTWLSGIGADAASLAGSTYLLLDRQGDARAYLNLAESLARESEDPTLQAGVLGCMSRMHSPTEGSWIGGDATTALVLVEQASELAPGAPAPMRAWLGGRTAIEQASSAHSDASARALDEARRVLSEDAGERDLGGFFGSFLAVRDESHLTSLEGLCHVLLGHGDRAEATLLTALSEVSPARTRLPVILLSDLAAAYIVQDSPEQACQSLVEAHELATLRGYRTGVQRIRSVRARMPERWTDLPSVRELDDRLTL